MERLAKKMTANLDDLRRQATLQWDALQSSPKPRILVGTATCGRSAGALEAREAFEQKFQEHDLDCEIIEVGCIGLCYAEPIVCVIKPSQPAVVYHGVTPKRAAEIADAYLVGNDPLADYALGTFGDGSVDGIPPLFETPVFKPQIRRTLKNCGFIDPSSIDHYLANGGYTGLTNALAKSPEQVIEEVKNSGLRGRGGAGFQTGLKWEYAALAAGRVKYVLCNADEGDPGAFMDRSVLEADPHAVLEGMLIAARSIGAQRGYIYCRAEYPLALRRLNIAIEQARDFGLLGENILGSGFDFDLEVYQGAGAFVCGEETALISSIEGRRGMPRPRPPFPAQKGLWGCPTVLNNVETYANIPQIISNGPEWFSCIGTETSKGTKVFALTGDVNNIGLVEVPMGTSLRSIIFDIGGGIPDKRKFKAVQLGGPSGGCVSEKHLDIPVDYESIASVGAIMGSGGMIVMNDKTCMVDMARFFMDFIQDESCGKCTPCREGTRRMLELLQSITRGEGQEGDIERLEDLCDMVKDGSLCGLGQTAPNPVLSTLQYFRDEYEAHIRQKKCTAKRCPALLDFTVDQQACKKCGICFKCCPVQAVAWKKGETARIDRAKCVKCMSCITRCPFDAIN
jgi:NADH:ubiquinone oxidoreductase subunit F (NADH-binding)/NAD-dependent dihydropyrimidine dehydrogenase PreA subunit/(2Fe-2S) ferredoxin